MPILEAVNLKKTYGRAVALEGITLAIEPGDLFGLLGPNGAGKTTLLSLFCGLLTPTQGQVKILNHTLKAGETGWRRHLGIVPQDLALYEDLTARENLYFFGGLYGPAGRALEQSVEDVLDAMGLADRAQERVSQFSGGMKRRLNLGVALVHRPQVLLLDEPTVGVDPQSRNHIFAKVKELHASGVTVAYTSHYMEEVQTLCRRVGILDQGRLVACDSLDRLLQRSTGALRFSAGPLAPQIQERVRGLPEVSAARFDGNRIELECAEVRGTLSRLLALLNEHGVDFHSLEMEEPNLERVFFDLTHTALRD